MDSNTLDQTASAVGPQTKVGRIAAVQPSAVKVLMRHGIDYCCGGGIPLSEACAEKGLDVATVLEEIEAAASVKPDDEALWVNANTPELIDHILHRYHAELREELPRIEFMARKVARVHGDKRPDILPAIVETFVGLKDELEAHMDEEEKAIFPALRSEQPVAPELLADLHGEHVSAAKALERLRELTDDFQVPPEACRTWRALWEGLSELESTMHQHVHLENNILFPRATTVAA